MPVLNNLYVLRLRHTLGENLLTLVESFSVSVLQTTPFFGHRSKSSLNMRPSAFLCCVPLVLALPTALDNLGGHKNQDISSVLNDYSQAHMERISKRVSQSPTQLLTCERNLTSYDTQDSSRDYPTSNNPVLTPDKQFYNRVSGDAPFSVPEDQLRAAIYLPPSFTYGKKQPVIMSPGTGSTGFSAFTPNMGKLLAQTDFADPVYLNVPGYLLGDIQIHAEYASYAIQYLNAVTDRKPAIVSWSQGSINSQWAFKYWPSTRNLLTDHIAISPDYHGTFISYLLCSGGSEPNEAGCTPAFKQQEYKSKFISQLRDNDGDSAYVPTTTVYSAFDQIVQPQVFSKASGFIKDVRGVRVSNTFLQRACFWKPAGGKYLHEGVLFNPVAYALVVDALQNEGPGKFERVKDQCANSVTEGLTTEDVAATTALIPEAAAFTLDYQPKVVEEPEIKSYAQ